jgi:hypothetical protein
MEASMKSGAAAALTAETVAGSEDKASGKRDRSR